MPAQIPADKDVIEAAAAAAAESDGEDRACVGAAAAGFETAIAVKRAAAVAAVFVVAVFVVAVVVCDCTSGATALAVTAVHLLILKLAWHPKLAVWERLSGGGALGADLKYPHHPPIAQQSSLHLQAERTGHLTT